MPKFLIAYASRHGHTAKIATRIAEVLRADGHTVVICDDVADTDPWPRDYDAVIAGASIHAGHHEDELIRWARRHAIALTMLPSAFFSVCLTAADDSDHARAITRDYLDDFEERTGWTPDERTTFAGALQYLEYGVLTRLSMRALMHRGHRPADTSRDYDYTDWGTVERFAHECGALLPTFVAASNRGVAP